MHGLVLRQCPRQRECSAQLGHEQVTVIRQQGRMLLDGLQVWKGSEEPKGCSNAPGPPLVVGGVEEHQATLHDVALTGG